MMTMTRWLGLFALATAVVIIFVWIPLDVETGIIEKVRRQTQLGDAFAPFVATLIIGVGGVVALLERHTTVQVQAPQNTTSQIAQAAGSRPPSLADLKHALVLLVLLFVVLTLMRYTGPLLAHLIRGDTDAYRLLRDTVPWKYAGFSLGGFVLIVGLIAYVEKRFRWLQVLIALGAVAALIAIYDLPFEDLLLPPNGDV